MHSQRILFSFRYPRFVNLASKTFAISFLYLYMYHNVFDIFLGSDHVTMDDVIQALEMFKQYDQKWRHRV